MQNTNPEKKKDRVLYAVLACMVAVIIILIILLLRGCPGPETTSTVLEGYERDPNASLGQLENKTAEEIQAELDRIVEEGMFNVSINNTPVFENGSAAGNLRIENIPANHYNMTVKITLDETGETIYQSGIIEPNHHIENDTLDKVLAKGNYAATATFTAHDPETDAELGKAAIRITIMIQN